MLALQPPPGPPRVHNPAVHSTRRYFLLSPGLTIPCAGISLPAIRPTFSASGEGAIILPPVPPPPYLLHAEGLVWWSHAGVVLRGLHLGFYQIPPASESAPQRPVEPRSSSASQGGQAHIGLGLWGDVRNPLDDPPPPTPGQPPLHPLLANLPSQLVHPYRTFQYGWRSCRQWRPC